MQASDASIYLCFFCSDEDDDGDRITVCNDEELGALLSYVGFVVYWALGPLRYLVLVSLSRSANVSFAATTSASGGRVLTPGRHPSVYSRKVSGAPLDNLCIITTLFVFIRP